MSANYLIHLQHEWEQAKQDENHSQKTSAEREAVWLRSIDRTKHGEWRLAQLKKAQTIAEEEFRNAHFRHSTCRTRVAEIEEEIFDISV